MKNAVGYAGQMLPDLPYVHGLRTTVKVVTIAWATSLAASVAAEAQSCQGWARVFPEHPLPERRFDEGLSSAPGGGLLMFGGASQSNSIMGDFWRFREGRWSQLRSAVLPAARQRACMVLDEARGRVVLSSGIDASPNARFDTWEWDGSTWTPITVPSDGRLTGEADMAAYDVANSRVVVYQPLGTGSILRAWTGATWQILTPAGPSPGSHASAMFAYDRARQRLVLCGGRSENTGLGVLLSDVWEFDGTSWVERTPPSGSPTPFPQTSASFAWSGSLQKLVLFGGAQRNIAEAWSWDGTAWERLPDLLPAHRRTDHRAVFDATDGSMRLWGGGYNDLPILRSNGWSDDFVPDPAPSTAFRGTAANGEVSFDSVRDRVVVTRQRRLQLDPVPQLTIMTDTWEWDGAQWLNRSGEVGPGPTVSGPQVFDPIRGRTYVLGNPPTQIHAYDGNNWTLRTDIFPSMSPACTPAVMFWHPHLAQVVAFGGVTTSGTETNALSAFDGSGWASLPVTATRPTARFAAFAAYDENRAVVVLYGGTRTQSSPVTLTDTWEYNGSTWTPINPTGGVHPGVPLKMYYDTVLRRCIVIDTNKAVWSWNGTAWSTRSISPAHPSSLSMTNDIVFDTIRERAMAVHIEGDSQLIALTDVSAPQLTQPPQSASVEIGDPVLLTVVATGLERQYQWRRDGQPLLGEDRASLSIAQAAVGDAGSYDVQVFNGCGAVTSPAAVITIVNACPADFNGIGGLTLQDLFDFLAAWFAQCTGQASSPCFGRTSDFNGNGGVTVQDLFDYLAAWFGGC